MIEVVVHFTSVRAFGEVSTQVSHLSRKLHTIPEHLLAKMHTLSGYSEMMLVAK